MNADNWLSQLIDKLLHVMHGQWIYRNISKHHATLGSIRKAEQQQMLLEIDQVLQLSPEDVPEESRFLFEIDFSAMRFADTTAQNYWVHAVKAAMVASCSNAAVQCRVQEITAVKVQPTYFIRPFCTE